MSLTQDIVCNYLDTEQIQYDIHAPEIVTVPIGMYNGGGSDISAIIECLDGQWTLSKVYDDEDIGIRADTFPISSPRDLYIIADWLRSSEIGTIPASSYVGNYPVYSRCAGATE